MADPRHPSNGINAAGAGQKPTLGRNGFATPTPGQGEDASGVRKSEPAQFPVPGGAEDAGRSPQSPPAFPEPGGAQSASRR